MSYDLNMFKPSVRGFDKDEVLKYLEKLDDEKAVMVEKYERELDHRNKVINDLKNRIVMKDEQVDQLEETIRNRYQKYIDHYEQIGELVYDSRMKADQILADANAQAEKILADADAEAKKRVASVKGDVETQIKEGNEKYSAICQKMDEVVDTFNKMQKKFVQSYKEIHEIADARPDHVESHAADSEYDESVSGLDGFEDDEDDDDLDLLAVGKALDDDDFDLDEDTDA